ncbi:MULTISPECIES: hypothetical protein [Sphingomonas]|uniref:Uncharacterized protein n=1 Tax=Sphingomonas trueperi TaxID=53317 RepID=A0A7X5XYS1_9SPHN|nr:MULTISPECIES: hypothetical protein [Sphingomonas]NJB97867.1 hypothetical protein [Sphingomonas trueperi]
MIVFLNLGRLMLLPVIGLASIFAGGVPIFENGGKLTFPGRLQM